MTDTQKGPREIPESPDDAARAFAGDCSDMTDDELFQWEAFL
jgi:hypothetical protein